MHIYTHTQIHNYTKYMQTFYEINTVGAAFPKAIQPTLLIVEVLLSIIRMPNMKAVRNFQVMPLQDST